MPPTKQSPALGAGPRETDLAGELVNRDSKANRHDLQVRHLTRRCAISTAMATIVAALAFGERSS